MKKFLIVIVLLTAVGTGGYFLSPEYLKTAIKYQTPDIDDYKIFANRTIKAGNYIPWEIADDYNKKGISEITQEKIDKLEPVAFLVVQDNKIKYEKYWQGYNENSLSNSFSMAKTIISLLIGIAIDEGHIKSVNQKVGDFIPEFAIKPNDILTIKDLLTMSSGLNWDEAYSSPFSITTQAYYGTDLFGLIKDLKVVEEPGQQWKYLSGNTQVLAFILKNATGMNVADYASEKLWKPLGAKNDAIWCLDKENGMEKAYCCFNSNARDFARIGQMVLNNGMFDGVEVVSKKYIDEATKPAINLASNKGKLVNFYGYQFWIIHYRNYQIPFARGILGQYIFVIPEKNAVVVRLGHKRSDKRTYNSEMPDDIYLYLDAAIGILD
jgi:CubicO group peptidase (beta-lactamase class C family)